MAPVQATPDAPGIGAALPERVLVVRLGAIGDVTNALVFATALKRLRPTVRVGWVVHALAEPLVRDHPDVDVVHRFARDGGVRAFVRVVREVRAERYGLAVDLQRIQKSALVARASGAPRVLGYDRRRTKEQSWVWTGERIAPADGGRHMVEQYLDVAAHLGCAEPLRPRLGLDSEAEAWAEERVAALGAPPVAIALGATKPANRWASERFGELARALAELGPVAVTGGPAEREAARAIPALPGVHDFVGETSLRQLAALLSRARVLVSCDTGPMHLAAAAGTPVVALFGAADPRRTGPYPVPGGADDDLHRVVRELPECAPCGRRHCNQPRHTCMEELPVARVLAAVRGVLSAGTGTSSVAHSSA